MITSSIKRDRKAPRVVAVFSFRYDAHLVPAMLANIDSMVDGWVCYDDTNSEGLFSDEVRRRSALLRTARELGARWALAIDPDERFEAGLAHSITSLTASDNPVCYTFALREMYTEDQYRIDGVWGQKRQARLLPLSHGLVDPAERLHLPWSYFVPGAEISATTFNLYHLKMITSQRRQARAALYNHLDPDRRMQSLGYDYLADEQGLELEAIPAGRGYFPRHVEDGGLWMPPVNERK